MASHDLAARQDLLLAHVSSLVAEEVGRLRGRPLPEGVRRDWRPGTRMDEDGVGADSLMRLELAARLDEAFHLGAHGVEDYLLHEPTLGGWTALVAEAFRRGVDRMVFRSSGSTGRSKRITHALADLVKEAVGHAAVLPPTSRIVSLVPPHHLYGFLLTVLGPAMQALPVLDLRGATPGAVFAALRRGDRVVATPFLWSLLLRLERRPPPEVHGVTSTAPCPPGTFEAVRMLGFDSLTEVYGSTETGGLGWRRQAGAPFRQLPHLVFESGPPPSFRIGDRELEPPDVLEAAPSARFRVLGRRDGVVQVGGVNVDPAAVAARLRAHPGVADCCVRLDGDAADARLKAFVVPACDGAAPDPEILVAWCAKHLTAPERPARFRFGATLPRDAHGKPLDWDPSPQR